MNESMLAAIEAHYRETCPYTGCNALADPVREALLHVDRRHFVPHERGALALCDAALPIGCGQTISQPFIVALMTQLLAPQVFHTVLEVGTGSGYQAAVLAELVARVHTVEIIAELANDAADRLQSLGYRNIEVHAGDGYHGLPLAAPFDGIIITAALPSVPLALLEQLRIGGRLVAPLGQPHQVQQLVVMEKQLGGEISTRNVLPVSFVPFTRAH
ncbi:MAG TPA: protein-L-isoaspartate(D-aspartate) O-methyltransferase [Spongiibacteraceae bacterium]|jgi:protein-L-isoaspartate(D-aspartate) O-methyltransferase|nr:protein-L-isoaspartate(D-aspartate) O-methyltransferase [Spongiibacteraceae bacterium]HUH38121.1 protein-L-isoaspartate(D-aspartate) O-methyltransferase [Spongiibacteraceae bacterium]